MKATQRWNPADYAANGRFVATLASPVVELLNPQPGEHILDLGCGDGALTAELARHGAHLTGIDQSPEMVAAARQRANGSFPVHQADVRQLSCQAVFDAVFSNAALHWLPQPDHAPALQGIHAALRPGGRFVAELGGLGNIAAIRTALSATLAPHGLDPELLAASWYPSPAAYRALLEQAGFKVVSLELHPRPTLLPNGSEGMHTWLTTFRNGVLQPLPEQAKKEVLQQTVELLRPILFDPATHTWQADYVRLRLHAVRPA